MIWKLLAVLLAAALVLSTPVMALSPKDFSGGSLSGVAADGDALLVTDTFNKVVWRVEGETVTRSAGQIAPAGLNGEPVGGYDDGTLDTALFMEPWAIVPFLDGFAVSDAAANVIRYIGDDGVYTAAGSRKAGSANGGGEEASFDLPTGLAVDERGAL